MSHQVTNDQKPAVADRNGDFAPIDSSDPIFVGPRDGNTVHPTSTGSRGLPQLAKITWKIWKPSDIKWHQVTLEPDLWTWRGKKTNSRLAPCRQVGDTPSLRRKMMVKQEMVGDSSSRQAAILGDKVVCFSYGFPIVFLCFSQLSYGFPMCIFIYTFISCLTTLHPY